MDIPSSNPSLITPAAPEQGSNGSSIGSGIGGDESSSVSSVDDYLLEHESSSPVYTQEEREFLDSLFTEDDMNELLLEGILDQVSPFARMHHEILQSRFDDRANHSAAATTTTIDNGKWFEEIIKGIQSAREQEQKTAANSTAKDTLNGKRPAPMIVSC